MHTCLFFGHLTLVSLGAFFPLPLSVKEISLLLLLALNVVCRLMTPKSISLAQITF